MSRSKVLIAIVAAIAAGTAVLVALLSHASSGSSAPTPNRTALFAALSAPASGPVDDQIRAIANDVGADSQDLQSARTLATGLGRFQSRLVAFPSFHGQNICYSLLAAKPTDPGVTYCYRPRDVTAPKGLADEHASVAVLQSRTGPSLDLGTQVSGVAEDDVASVRILVAGTWQKIPIVNNALYLDLPGIARTEVGSVETTLSDGSTELHDFQTGQ